MTEANRRFRACLAANALWLLLAITAVALRYEGQHWGYVLGKWQRDALAEAMVLHAAGLFLCAALIAVSLLRTMRSDRWARLALAFLPLLVLISVDRLATIEFRAIQPSAGLLKVDPVRIWSNRPDWTGKQFGVTYSINALGLRGGEIPIVKPEGQRRVLVLGDSIAFGLSIEQPDLMVTHLRDLADARFQGNELDWINGSVIGYSPWQEFELFKAVGLPLDPDLIVHVFCLNDIGEKFNLVQYGGSTQFLAPPEPLALEWSGLVRMIRDLSLKWFGPTREELRARSALYSDDRTIDEPDAPEIQEAWCVTLKNMGDIVDLARRRALPMAIICFPQARQIDADPPSESAPQEMLRRFCMRRNVPFLDLLPTYRAVRREQHLTGEDLFPDGTHPTADANRIAAQTVFSFLVKQQLLPPEPRSAP